VSCTSYSELFGAVIKGTLFLKFISIVNTQNPDKRITHTQITIKYSELKLICNIL